jgi:indole-3-glycerol phosphate synthase
MNVLESIMAERLADAREARRGQPLEELKRRSAARTHHSLADSLGAGGGSRIIAEVKRASPSAGILCPGYRPEAIAACYEKAGAAGVSVLTEPRHFQGRLEHLEAVREAVALPVLRKDFTGDVYQVWEAAAWGADVVLLIVAALDRGTLEELYATAVGCGLDVLVETHTREELEAALALDRAIVGVNSRNLKTLKTDLGAARELARHIPANRLSVAESGIRERADIEELEALGYSGFLVGETLMRAEDPAAALQRLMGVPREAGGAGGG